MRRTRLFSGKSGGAAALWRGARETTEHRSKLLAMVCNDAAHLSVHARRWMWRGGRSPARRRQIDRLQGPRSHSA
eukprot:15473822-Alexandrium_andersonii.AAC.1